MVARDAKQERANVERAAEHRSLVGVPAWFKPQCEVGDLGQGTRAPPQPPFGIQAAAALLSDLVGYPEQAGGRAPGALGGRVGSWEPGHLGQASVLLLLACKAGHLLLGELEVGCDGGEENVNLVS